jgi:ribosome-binding factor A
MVTVSVVDVSPDLKNAKVYVTSFGDDVEMPRVIESLNDMSGHFRHELSQLLSIRVTPKLVFVYDKSIEHGSHLSALIDSLNKEDK